MKKLNKFYFVLGLAIATLFLTGCSDRDPIDRADFITIMKESGFEVHDLSEQAQFAENIFVAIPQHGHYQIEFYEFATAT